MRKRDFVTMTSLAKGFAMLLAAYSNQRLGSGERREKGRRS